MAETTGISWTEKTWNPWRGCQRISPGCKNCYMFAEQKRYGKDPSVVVRTKTWGDPLKWQRQAAKDGKTEMVSTCSWSDWFISEADEWRAEAWEVVKRTPNLNYQILTKRAGRIKDHLPPDWGQGYPNAWLGVSVEDRKYGLPRIDLLRGIPAAVRFLSVEPQLEGLGKIDLAGIHWVIVGGESSNRGSCEARPFNLAWARSLRDQCRAAGVAFFFKQAGSNPLDTGLMESVPNGDTKYTMDDLRGEKREEILETFNECFRVATLKLRDKKGGDLSEIPSDLQIREFPISQGANP